MRATTRLRQVQSAGRWRRERGPYRIGRMATLGVERLDHLILTVRDVDTTCAFYQRVLGMQIETFGHGRKALRFGRQKINVEIGEHPAPGGTHLCFITTAPLGDWIEHLKGCGVLLREGPVKRNGAEGTIESLYLNDPDDNSIEIARY
jgi:catechol 2,3-dioxygenase-like lactoylglutathione lyase family enzyme